MRIELEGLDGLISFQQGVDSSSQVTDALAVNDTYFENTARAAFGDVFRHEFVDIFRVEVMEIEDAVNGILDRIVGRTGHVSI